MAGSTGDDEVWRRRLGRVGITPEEFDEALANVREATPEDLAAAPEPGSGPGISWFTDGSVVRRDDDGSETVLRGPDHEQPDADVRSLDERRGRD